MYRFFQLFIPALILSSCFEGAEDVKKPAKDLIQYASRLEILEEKDHVAVNIVNPITGKRSHFLLSSKEPTSILNGQTWIKTPVASMITLSGTHIGMLSKLNETDRIKGVTNRNYIYNPNVVRRINQGKVLAFDNEESIPVESIIRSQAELLIYSGFGSDFPHQEQLKKTGTVCMPNYDWQETHPLGKAEWIKLFGFLTGKEKEATAYFDRVVKEYNELKTIGRSQKAKPTVFSGNMFGDIWFCPAGESFNAQLIADAGGNYRYNTTKGTGSLELSPETVFHDNVNTEFWVNPGTASLDELRRSNPKAAFYGAFQNGKVYCYSPNMNLFWEMSAIEPQRVLSDLLSILHPESLNRKPYFYQLLK